MAKYLKKFETSAAYTAAESTLDKPNVSYIVETNGVEFNPYVPPQPIRYTASAKLNKTWSDATTTFGATIKSHTFENGVGTIEFDGDVTSIGDEAFYECTGLISVTIPDSVTSIGVQAFNNCSGLTNVTIPDGVTSISEHAFEYCTGLTIVTIGSGVTSIGNYAFYNCSGLTSITIPDSVTSIGSSAFYNCSGLTSITIPSGVTGIGSSAFSGCYFTSSNFVNNSSLDEVTNSYWGATIVDTDINGLLIKDYEVVKYRGTITSVTIPNSVTSIGANAFYNCRRITSITIPSSVTSIGNYAFYHCSSLTSITIPNSVTSIGANAFYNCTGLTSITCNATTAPTIQFTTFQNVKTGGTLTVPTGSTGYDVWMGTGNYYLGKYNWTKVEQ